LLVLLRVSGRLWYLIRAGDCSVNAEIWKPSLEIRIIQIMRKDPSFIHVLLATLLVFGGPVHAASTGLYTGDALVSDQSAAEQNRAMRAALQQVLGKISGLRDFESYPDVEGATRDARDIAVASYYKKHEISLPDGSTQEQLFLVADFSRTAVDELVQTLQLPIWEPVRRPLTVWLVVDDPLGRRVMPIELEYAWENALAIASDRGMPLVRPLPDEEGNYAVDPQLLWGGYTEELVESGPADALVMAARREGPEWNVRMNLDYMGQVQSWRNRDVDIQLAVIDGMQMAIDDIAAMNSIASEDQGRQTVNISVSGISAAADYANCLAYLQGLSLVENVQVTAAHAGTVEFALNLNALPEYLVRQLESDSVLNAEDLADSYRFVR
jgi:hypothetical protein